MFFLTKDNFIWTIKYEAYGYCGKNGIGKMREGDNKTPIGEYGLISAFGIKDNPGTKLEYIIMSPKN